MGFKTFEKWWPERDLETTTDLYNGQAQRYDSLVKIVTDIYNMSDTDFNNMMDDMQITLKHNQDLMQDLIESQDNNRIKIYHKVNEWCNT